VGGSAGEGEGTGSRAFWCCRTWSGARREGVFAGRGCFGGFVCYSASTIGDDCLVPGSGGTVGVWRGYRNVVRVLVNFAVGVRGGGLVAVRELRAG
jgi:hypothetical protein